MVSVAFGRLAALGAPPPALAGPCDPTLEERDWNASHENVMLGRVYSRANVVARVRMMAARRSLRDEEDR